jgi:phenylacetate-CoA ligase
MTIQDDRETRSPEARAADQLAELNAQLMQMQDGAPEAPLAALSGLADLPVLRKAALAERQAANRPFGGIRASNVGTLFQSPGPIYEPGGIGPDWWRIGRFLRAAGIGTTDIVQNCFGYHLTPAGHMFESGARVGAAGFEVVVMAHSSPQCLRASSKDGA